MKTSSVENGKFKKDTVVIDVNCDRYRVEDVRVLGPSWWPWNYFARDQRMRVEYVYSPPERVTFEAARQEITELIIAQKWRGRTEKTQKEFREEMAKLNTMQDLFQHVSFYGKWMF